MSDLAMKLLISALLTLLIKGVVALTGHSIAWWLAAVVALVIAFGGWLIIIDSDGAWD